MRSIATGGDKGAVVPVVTVAPSAELLAQRQDPDAISLAQVLLTAVPQSLRQIAATNLPAASSILWNEFLDDQRPEWFEELPWELQTYLIRKFGPQTAWPTEAPTTGSLSGSDILATLTATASATYSTTTDAYYSTRTSSRSTRSRTTPASTERTSVSSVVATSFTTSYTSASFHSSVSSHSSRSSYSSPSKASTASSQSFSSQTSTTWSHTVPSSLTPSTPSGTFTPSPTAVPEAPVANSSLSKEQKIGIGVGIPVGLLGAAALLFAFCLLCRRRKKKHVEGSIPPASPGFIPRFAFQDRSQENVEHRTSLIRTANRSMQEVSANWEDEGVDPPDSVVTQNPYAWNDLEDYNPASALTQVPSQAPTAAAMSSYAAQDNDTDADHYSKAPVMTMQDPTPIMTPTLYHTHSSNRARGRRTSYTNLHSVAELSEPDEIESPVLGRNVPPNHSPARNLMPTPPIPADAQIRRKPVPSSPPLPSSPTSLSPVATSPAAQAASHKLLRQTMPEHSGSSSSGLALTTSSGLSSNSSLAVHAEATSPVSPISNRAPSNPFHYDSYVEDYGPEYQYGYVDVDDGLYGGNTSLSQYPERRRKSSKTEWPLRSMVGSHQRRRSSPLWERIYEE